MSILFNRKYKTNINLWCLLNRQHKNKDARLFLSQKIQNKLNEIILIYDYELILNYNSIIFYFDNKEFLKIVFNNFDYNFINLKIKYNKFILNNEIVKKIKNIINKELKLINYIDNY
jgi:hypothetical protein